MRISGFCLVVGLSALLLGACTTRDAAQLGAMVGHAVGRPLGVVATAVDESINTASDVVRENPRYLQQSTSQEQAGSSTAVAHGQADAYYYRAEVLVKTRGPAQLEGLTLQQTEDVSEFWR